MNKNNTMDEATEKDKASKNATEAEDNDGNEEDKAEEDSKPAAKHPRVQRLPGESDAELNKRRNKIYKDRNKKKRKKKNEEDAAKLKFAIKSCKENARGEENDVFITKVVGRKNFDIENPRERYEKCKNAVSFRLCIEEFLVKKRHVESKNFTIVSKDEFRISFHMHPTLDADDDNGKQKEVRKYPDVDWLMVKKSTIDGAGLGVFADDFFPENSIIGLYMGGTDGDEKYTIQAGWNNGPAVRCFSLTSSESKHERNAKTMGMQMINDPNFEGQVSGNEVNAEIKKGEEIFIDYNMSASSSEDDDDNDLEDDDGSDDSKDAMDCKQDDGSKDSKSSDAEYLPEKGGTDSE